MILILARAVRIVIVFVMIELFLVLDLVLYKDDPVSHELLFFLELFDPVLPFIPPPELIGKPITEFLRFDLEPCDCVSGFVHSLDPLHEFLFALVDGFG